MNQTKLIVWPLMMLFLFATLNFLIYDQEIAWARSQDVALKDSYKNTTLGWYLGTFGVDNPISPLGAALGLNVLGGHVDVAFDNIGFFTILAMVGAVSLLIGVRVFNTGVNEGTVQTTVLILGVSAVWLLLSGMTNYAGVDTFQMITSIPYFGGLLYMGMTFCVALGVVLKLGGHD